MGKKLLVISILCVGITILCVSCRGDREAKQRVPAYLAGEWIVESAEINGELYDDLNGVLIEIDDSSCKWNLPGRTLSHLLSTDVSASPMQFDQFVVDNNGHRNLVPGIFKVEQGKLFLCRCDPDFMRPFSFDTKANRQALLYIFRKPNENDDGE